MVRSIFYSHGERSSYLRKVDILPSVACEQLVNLVKRRAVGDTSGGVLESHCHDETMAEELTMYGILLDLKE